jgi:hypothetical protein
LRYPDPWPDRTEVINEDIDPAFGFCDLICHRTAGFQLSGIIMDIVDMLVSGFVFQFFDPRLCPFPVSGGHVYDGAFFCAGSDSGKTDSAGGSGDKDYFLIQSHGSSFTKMFFNRLNFISYYVPEKEFYV